MTAALYDHRNEFSERNPFLLVLLGMLSCSVEIERALPRLVGANTSIAPHNRSTANPEPALCLLLGIVSVSRTIHAHANVAAATVLAAEPALKDEAPVELDLRQLLES